VVHLDQMAFLLFEDALGERIQVVVRGRREHGHAVFGAEDEVDEDLRKRLSHVDDSGCGDACRTLSACPGSSYRYPRAALAARACPGLSCPAPSVRCTRAAASKAEVTTKDRSSQDNSNAVQLTHGPTLGYRAGMKTTIVLVFFVAFPAVASD